MFCYGVGANAPSGCSTYTPTAETLILKFIIFQLRDPHINIPKQPTAHLCNTKLHPNM